MHSIYQFIIYQLFTNHDFNLSTYFNSNYKIPINYQYLIAFHLIMINSNFMFLI